MDANVRRNTYKGQIIHPNQFIFAKISTARRWKQNQNTLYKDLLRFEADGIISREIVTKGGKHRFTIITILTIDVRK